MRIFRSTKYTKNRFSGFKNDPFVATASQGWQSVPNYQGRVPQVPEIIYPTIAIYPIKLVSPFPTY